MANISELDADLGILYNEIDTDLRQNEHDGSDPCNDTKSSESEQTDIYCTINCKFDRKTGKEEMFRCCSCMTWYHPSCCGESKRFCKNAWNCLECRNNSQRIANLEKKVDKLTDLNLKLLVLLHDKHKKLLESPAVTPSVNNVTVERQTVRAKPKTVSCGTQTSLLHVVQAEQRSKQETDKKIKVQIVCDSIPQQIKPEDLTDSPTSVSCNVSHVAPTVNHVTDYIQDEANASVTDLTLIHSGTNIIRREPSHIVNQRIDRLTSNIISKKLKNVALSSVVYRNDPRLDAKIRIVNNHIRSTCARHGFMYVENDNIDESCLSNDHLHLNRTGLDRLAVNFKLVILPRMKERKYL